MVVVCGFSVGGGLGVVLGCFWCCSGLGCVVCLFCL